MKRFTYTITLFIILIAAVQPVLADTFSVQGVLRDPLGKTVPDGSYSLEFNLYTVVTGGTAIWTETHSSVSITHGVFSVEMGSVNSLADVPFDTQYWIGVSVIGGGEAEMTPRFKVSRVPAAMSVYGTENIFPSIGNVGVGTKTPSASLHIVADPSVTNDLLIEDASANPKLVVNSSNQVGIGVSSPNATLNIRSATDTENRLLVEKSDGTASVVIDQDGKMGVGVSALNATLNIRSATDTENRLLVEKSDGTASVVVDQDGQLGIGVSAPGAVLHIQPDNDLNPKLLVEAADGSDMITITADGKLGVGVPADSINDPLTVNGNVRLRNGGAIAFDDGTSIASANFGGSATGVASPGNAMVTADALSAGTGDVQLITGATTRLTVKNDGKVGIGTDAPSQLLTLNSSGITRLSVQSGGSTGLFTALGSDPTDGPYYIWKNTKDLRFATASDDGGTAWSEKMRVTSTGDVGIGTGTPSNKLTVSGNADFTGNVGIGITSPSYKLHVDGSIKIGNAYTADARNTNILYIGDASHIQIGEWEADDMLSFKASNYSFTNGNVGIGTASPSNKLTVSGNADFTGNVGIGTASPTQLLTLNSSGITRFAIQSGGSTGLFTTLGTDPTDGPYYIWKNTKDLRFATADDDGGTGWSEKMRITSGGYVGIGTTTPAERLHIKGNAMRSALRIEQYDQTDYWSIGMNNGSDDNLAFSYNGAARAFINYSNGTWNVYSDRRLKKNIEPIGGVLGKVLRLKPVSYNFKDAPDNTPKSIGFVAQDVEQVFPELVTEKEYRSLSYQDFGVLAIAAIKELNQKVEDLEARVAELEKVSK